MVQGMRLALFIDYFKFQKLVMVVLKELRIYIKCSDGLQRKQKTRITPEISLPNGPIRIELSTSWEPGYINVAFIPDLTE